MESTVRSVGISKYYLSRIFSEKLGYSFLGYLAMLRTELAKELLETTECAISLMYADLKANAAFSAISNV